MVLNVYPATKHAVTALTTTMEVELLGSKIRCTVSVKLIYFIYSKFSIQFCQL